MQLLVTISQFDQWKEAISLSLNDDKFYDATPLEFYAWMGAGVDDVSKLIKEKLINLYNENQERKGEGENTPELGSQETIGGLPITHEDRCSARDNGRNRGRRKTKS